MIPDHLPDRADEAAVPFPATDGTMLCSSTCSRRDLFARLGVLIAVAACGSDSPAGTADPQAVSVAGNVITLRLNLLDALRTIGSSFVISDQRVIVIRIADRDYRAFTNVCTHSGCGISLFQAPRMICQCHGSEYDVEGINVAGPAPLPLTRYPAALDTPGTTLRITLAP